MNTLVLKVLNAREIKEHLKERANQEGRDLSLPENRFTLFSENGNAGFSYEDHAEHDYQIAPKMGNVMLKNKRARRYSIIMRIGSCFLIAKSPT
jgi:hypothetical protein